MVLTKNRLGYKSNDHFVQVSYKMIFNVYCFHIFQ